MISHLISHARRRKSLAVIYARLSDAWALTIDLMHRSPCSENIWQYVVCLLCVRCLRGMIQPILCALGHKLTSLLCASSAGGFKSGRVRWQYCGSCMPWGCGRDCIMCPFCEGSLYAARIQMVFRHKLAKHLSSLVLFFLCVDSGDRTFIFRCLSILRCHTKNSLITP